MGLEVALALNSLNARHVNNFPYVMPDLCRPSTGSDVFKNDPVKHGESPQRNCPVCAAFILLTWDFNDTPAVGLSLHLGSAALAFPGGMLEV